MRRTFQIVIALAMVLWGGSIVQGAAPTPQVALRDGGLLALLGLVFFAAVAPPPPALPIPLDTSRRGMAQILSVVGLLTLLAAAALAFAPVWLDVSALGDVPASYAAYLPLATWGLWVLGMILIGLAALRPLRSRTAPGTVWTVETARRLLESVDRRHTRRGESLHVGRRAVLGALLLVTALAALLRLWTWTALPAGCSELGCRTALQALDLLRSGEWQRLGETTSPLYTLLVALSFGVLAPNLETLRWVGLLLGTLTVPLFYLAASRVVRPALALLAALIFALAPWHVELSRYPDPGTLLLPALLIFVWLRLRTADAARAVAWIPAGLAAGAAVVVTPPSLVLFVLLWTLICAPWFRWRALVVYWIAALLAALPRLAPLTIDALWPRWRLPTSADASTWLAQLLRQADPVSAVLALLVLLGLVYLLRYWRWPPGWILWLGILSMGAALIFTQDALGAAGFAPLWGLASLAATAALDPLVGEPARIWAPVARPQALLTGIGLILLLLLGVGTISTVATWRADAAFVDRHGGDEAGIGRYLRAHVQGSVDNGGDPALLLVPRATLASPATRLAAGGVLASADRVLPLDPVLHLPLVGPPFSALPADGDLIYVVPNDHPVLLDRLRQIYPEAEPFSISGEPRPHVPAYAFAVPRAAALTRGLPVRYVAAGAEEGEIRTVASEQAGPLRFNWNDDLPVEPLQFEAAGTLYVPESGRYRFSAQTDASARLRLALGAETMAQTILDSEDARLETEVDLIQGFVPLRLTYASDADDPVLAVRWQRPGGQVEPIPRQALFAPLPDQGLIATYYDVSDHDGEAGDGFAWLADASPLDRRREPILLPGPLLGEGRAVVWQAKLAAPVEGVYAFSVMADGSYQLQIDGSIVLAQEASSPHAQSGSLPLARGWHDLTIRYRPRGDAADFDLAWQPPDAERGPIAPDYFAPYAADHDAAALPLPETPPLAGPATAPPAAADAAPPAPDRLRLIADELPQNLPELALEQVWMVGQCGAGDADLLQPRGVALLPNQARVYVADAGNRRVAAFDLATGEPVAVYTDERFEEPFDLAGTILDEVFLLDALSQRIFRLDPATDRVDLLPQNTSFYRPRGLGVDVSGTLYVADTGGARVVMLAPDGAVLAQFGGPDTPLGQGQPVDATALPNGAVYAVTAEDGVLWRLDRGEGQMATVPTNTFDAPHLASLANSTLWLTDPQRRLLLYYGADGQPLAQFSTDAFVTPVGIDATVFQDDLYVAVTDSANCTVSLWQMPAADLPPQ